MKIVFLILHYKIIEETIKCINSIFKYKNSNNIEIVIVDNGSNNGSGEKLNKLYGNKNNIHIITNKENLGFARGNNIGFNYAKKELSADFIVMANNDIIFCQDKFCDLIIEKYNQDKYAVLAPKVIMLDGTILRENRTVRTVTEQYIYIMFLYLKLFVERVYLGKIYKVFFHTYKKKTKSKEIDISERKENIKLYGCCIIFSQDYIKMFDGIDDRTFLYCEEDLLYLRLLRNNLKSLYEPELEVEHNHRVSTKKTQENKRKLEIFITKNLIKSNKILLKEIKSFNKYKRNKTNFGKK